MKQQSRLGWLIVIIVAIVSVITGGTLFVLYRMAVRDQGAWLAYMARSQASTIEAIGRFDAEHSAQAITGGAFAATLSQIREAHTRFTGFGRTGEFLLGQRTGNQIVFLLRSRQMGVDTSVSFSGQRATPMRRALLGESGVFIGEDYDGIRVLAAHEPVAELGLGIVAKIDVAEIRAPYTRGAGIAGATIVVCVVLGVGAFLLTMRDEEGKITTTLSSGQDIEKRKLAEQDLQVSEERFQRIFEGMQDAYLLVGMDGGVTLANPYAADLLGYDSPDDMTGLDLADGLAADRDDGARVLDQVRQESSIRNRELPLRRKDGAVLPIEGHMHLILSDAGELLGIEGVFRDVRERKEAEQELRKLSKAVEQSPAAVVITSRDGVIEYVNRVFTELTGFAAEEAIGQNPRILKSGNQQASVYEGLWRTVLAGEPWHGEFLNRTKDGRLVWMSVSISPITDDSGEITHLVSVQEDITERVRAQEELIAARESADVANRAKSEFLANMSHEIRTPMNAVLGFSEILDGLIQDPVHSEYLRSIRTSGAALLTLINDILDLSKVEAGKLELQFGGADVHALAVELQTIYGQKAEEKGIDLLVDVDDDVPHALIVDETRLRQVLINLIGNGVKFTAEGHVRLAISCENPPGDDGTVDLLLDVEDTGIGVPEDQLDSIFGAFEQQEGQSHEAFGGTGLGLAISKRLVEMMPGTIHVTSEAGQGSVFHVRLPGVAADEGLQGDDDTAPVDVDLVRFAYATVLVVDDVDVNRELVKGYLAGYDLAFIEGGDGVEAVEKTRESRPDVVLLDMKMPRMNGIEATEALKADPDVSAIPIVAITASAMEAEREQMEALVDGYLTKPVGKVDLVTELMRFLPHELSTPAETAPEQDAAATGELAIDLSPAQAAELLPDLRELVETCDDLSTTLSMDEITEAGEKVQALGEGSGVTALVAWGDELAAKASLFDIDALGPLLSDFAGIVAQIESVATGDAAAGAAPAIDGDAARELLSLLEPEQPVAAELAETLSMADIEAFGARVGELGAARGYAALTDWGARLCQQAELFDIDGLGATLGEFEDLVADLRSLTA
ncbi:hypothetical protein CMK11_08425 [Candidatus Poribacteria bacterium]|nr:hypothetical protein [Candidatus Poribacteria bacterium]